MENVFTNYIEKVNEQIKEKLGRKRSISVSKCINMLKPEFETEKVAGEMVEKYFDVEGHKYYHMSKEEIIDLWETKKNNACNRGMLFDSYVEQRFEIRDSEAYQEWYLEHNISEDMFMHRAMNGFNNIIKNYAGLGYTTVVGTEIPLFAFNTFDNTQVINGRCDCLLYNPTTKHFLIIDWKTNEEIKQSGYENMYGPMSNFPSCEYYGYILQVFFYKKALIETYKLGTSETVHVAICQMGVPENPNYRIFNDSIFSYTESLMNSIIKYVYLRKEYSKKQKEAAANK